VTLSDWYLTCIKNNLLNLSDISEEVVVVVNPISTGAHIADELSKRTYKVIALWTKSTAMNQRLRDMEFRAFASVDEQEALEDTLTSLKDAAKSFRIVACICGGEEGAALTDAVSENLGVRTNGTQIKRENRMVQQEVIMEAGLRGIRQVTGEHLSDEVKEFLLNEKYPVVVKPSEFVCTDGVKLCHDMNEAEHHFNYLVDMMNQSGMNVSVICQEFVKGKEYIIDNVSRDGVHKTTSKKLRSLKICLAVANYIAKYE
jgi:biotin carboxylase